MSIPRRTVSIWILAAILFIPITMYAQRSTQIARWGEGPSRSVCVTEDHMLRCEGDYLEVWSLSESILLGRLLMPGPVTDLETKDGFALVLTVDHGLFMVDLADPEVPVIDNFIPISSAIKLILQGDIAVIGAGEWFYWGGPSGTEIVDISDVHDPQLINTIAEGFPLACSDNLLFTVVIGCNMTGIDIWDVSDMYSVAYLGSTFNDGIVFPATALVQNELFWVLGEDNLEVWDVAEPSTPIFLNYTDLDLNQQLARKTNPFTLGDTLYFYDADNLRRLDISQPDTVVELTAFSCPGIVDIFPEESSVWTAREDHGVTQVAITDQDSLQIITEFSSIGTPQQVVSDGDKLAVQANQLHIFQPTQEDSILTAVSSIALLADEQLCLLTDNMVYLADSDQLRIIDIVEPTNPIQAGLLELSGITEVLFQSDLLYIYYQDQSIGIVDVEDPENPQLLDSWVVGEIEDISVTEGRLALLSGNNAQVSFYDISEPGELIYMGQPSLACNVDKIAILIDRLIVASNSEYLRLYDVTVVLEPELLVEVYSYHHGSSCLTVADGFLYNWCWNPINPDMRIQIRGVNNLDYLDNYNWGSAPQSIAVTGANLNLIYNTYGLVVVQNNAYDSVPTFTPSPWTISLSQNHPNPFNPSTTIEFSLPHPQEIQLVVYNIMGQRVATLAEGMYGTGMHRVTFEGSGLASGVYVYRLVAGTQVNTRKMILIR